MNAKTSKKIANARWGHFKVFGKSFKYNQLFNVFERTAETRSGITFTFSNDKKICVINGTATEDITQLSLEFTYRQVDTTHKYLILGFNGGSSDTFFLSLNRFANIYNDGIYQPSSSGSSRINITIKNGATLENVTLSPQIIDLTEVFGAGNEPTTLAEFYATDLGKAIQKGFYPPYSAENVIYSATTPFKFYKNDTLVSEYNPSPSIQLRSVNDIKDISQNRNGKIERKPSIVDLGSFLWNKQANNDEYSFWTTLNGANDSEGYYNISNILCSKYISASEQNTSAPSHLINNTISLCSHRLRVRVDDTIYNSFADGNAFKNSLSGVYLIYELATPTTETTSSIMLPKGITKCTDANGLELEMELLNDPSNFSNKILTGKNAPTITAEKVITKGFTSGGEHFTQLYIYDDGEIWYVNGGSSAQAFASNVWEIEYKQIQFDSGVKLTADERNSLLNAYDLI